MKLALPPCAVLNLHLWIMLQDSFRTNHFLSSMYFFPFLSSFWLNGLYTFDDWFMFNVLSRYHDMPDVIDFLVLRQFYDEARQRNWQPCKFFYPFILCALCSNSELQSAWCEIGIKNISTSEKSASFSENWKPVSKLDGSCWLVENTGLVLIWLCNA